MRLRDEIIGALNLFHVDPGPLDENRLRIGQALADVATIGLLQQRAIYRRDILTEGWSIHEMGTARMGTDPTSSVTNSFGQTHDIKNLFVMDGSAFPSSGCQNPTLTIMTLCVRSCDYLVKEMKKGEI